MSGTEAAVGDVVVETELAAEVSDNSSARELIERACLLLEVIAPSSSGADIALGHAKQAADWLRRSGL